MKNQTTINRFKKIMIEMYRGYPDYIFYGLFHDEFGQERAERIINLLQDDGLIIYGLNRKGHPSYKLTKKGVDFAIAMINLNLSQKTYKFNKRIYGFTLAIVIFTCALILIGIIQILK